MLADTSACPSNNFCAHHALQKSLAIDLLLNSRFCCDHQALSFCSERSHLHWPCQHDPSSPPGCPLAAVIANKNKGFGILLEAVLVSPVK